LCTKQFIGYISRTHTHAHTYMYASMHRHTHTRVKCWHLKLELNKDVHKIGLGIITKPNKASSIIISLLASSMNNAVSIDVCVCMHACVCVHACVRGGT